MDALYEAIALVVIVSLIGFWEWRSAVLMAISIPITLAMTFALRASAGHRYSAGFGGHADHRAGVAGRRSGGGRRFDQALAGRGSSSGNRSVAGTDKAGARDSVSRRSPTSWRISPFLALTGTTGEFLYSLPIVMTCALVASRLVSMTFIPFLGYYLLRPTKKKEDVDGRAAVARLQRLLLSRGKFRHRSSLEVVRRCRCCFWRLGLFFGHQLKTQFFPDDVQYLVISRCLAAE